MPSNQNTTVTFTSDQLTAIEAAATTAVAAIEQAGVWQKMYSLILTDLSEEGRAGPTAILVRECPVESVER